MDQFQSEMDKLSKDIIENVMEIGKLADQVGKLKNSDNNYFLELLKLGGQAQVYADNNKNSNELIATLRIIKNINEKQKKTC